MPADLSAAEIIALLREHPVCCGRLGIAVHESEDCPGAVLVESDDEVELWNDDFDFVVRGFRRWLTGACVEWCIENHIPLPVRMSQGWAEPRHDANTVEGGPTYLHALLAAIERHEEKNNA